jgi:hypothetical protein
MPPTEDKRKAARETIDVLYEISSLLVRSTSLATRRTSDGCIATLLHLLALTLCHHTNHHRTRI